MYILEPLGLVFVNSLLKCWQVDCCKLVRIGYYLRSDEASVFGKDSNLKRA